jgi:serine/threonine-protein kinase
VTPELHQQVRRLFDAAHDLPEEGRRAFLENQTGTAPEVLAEVQRLLAASAEAQSFLETSSDTARHIGRYRIERELGRGGMGIVYQATDPAINRKVALKLIRTSHALFDDDGFNRDSLVREARAAGPLRHPGIVTIYDVGEAEGVPFVAMELVEGASLFTLLSSGNRPDPARAIDILRQVAAALDYAHSRGIIHRDIKPANILLDHGSAVKITDFGIAKIVSGQASTLTGMQVGTAYYMSPEQILTQPLDGRSDQFALATMAFELLTGTLPFMGESATSISFKIVHDPCPSASAANPALPPAADSVFARGLGKLPAERFPSCADFVAALDAALRSPLPVEPPTRVSRSDVPAAGASPLPRIALGLVLAGLIGFALYRLWPAFRPAPAAEAAPTVRLFHADPPSIPSGATATLQWDTSGAQEVEIDHDVGKVAAAGTFAVKPSATTVYLLTARGAGGQTSVRASVEVTAPAKAPAPPKPKAEPAQPPALTREAQADRLYTDAMADLHAGRTAHAASQLRQAADLGNVSAMEAIGQIYWSGNGVARDDLEAIDWFQKAAAKGSAAAIYDLGIAYETGRGVRKDAKVARNLFRQAAEAGEPRAKARIQP